MNYICQECGKVKDFLVNHDGLPELFGRCTEDCMWKVKGANQGPVLYSAEGEKTSYHNTRFVKLNRDSLKGQSMKQFAEFVRDTPSIAYDLEGKRKFAKLGMKFLKWIVKEMPDLVETHCHYNPAGIATSGDLSLRAMFNSEYGFHLFFNLGGGSDWIFYRTIRGMKDYNEGHNMLIPFELLANPEEIIRRINLLRKKEQCPTESTAPAGMEPQYA